MTAGIDLLIVKPQALRPAAACEPESAVETADSGAATVNDESAGAATVGNDSFGPATGDADGIAPLDRADINGAGSDRADFSGAGPADGGDRAFASLDQPAAGAPSDEEALASIIVLEDGQAVEFVPLWETGRLHRNDIVLGVVSRHVPHLGGTFVRVGSGHDGLLRIRAGETPPSVGSRIIVTVQRESRAASQTGGSAADPAAEAKGPILSRQLALASRHAVFRPGMQPLRRTLLKTLPPEEAEQRFNADLTELEARHARLLKDAESGPAPRVLAAAGDPLLVLAHAFANRLRSIQVEGVERYLRAEQLLKAAAPDLLPRLKLHPPHFTYSLATVHRASDLARQLGSRRVRLPCGGTLVFDRTEALHVIDVNSGACQGASPAALADRVNREAVREIARQLRLRNLSGMILVDLIHQKDPARRDAQIASLREAVARDRGGVTIYGFTALNLLELVRKAH